MLRLAFGVVDVDDIIEGLNPFGNSDRHPAPINATTINPIIHHFPESHM